MNGPSITNSENFQKKLITPKRYGVWWMELQPSTSMTIEFVNLLQDAI